MLLQQNRPAPVCTSFALRFANPKAIEVDGCLQLPIFTHNSVDPIDHVDVHVVKAYAQDLRALLEQSGFIERKAFLRSFIKRIEVDKNRATVHYDLPVPPNGKSNEQTGVLPIETLGGAEGIRTPDLLRAKEALSQLSYSPWGPL